MIYTEGDITPYQELASAVVRLACADYVEAQIILNRKGALTGQQIKSLYKQFMLYGKKRYAFYYQGKLITQTPKRNLIKLQRLNDKLNSNAIMYRAEQEKQALERFFYGERFAIFMPHTDPAGLIERLHKKADRKEKISVGYESFLKYKYDD